MNKVLFFTFAVVCLAAFTLSASAALKPGDKRYGFRLLERRFVKEVNAECLLFEHEKSSARLLKIAADDANKTFAAAFLTLPPADHGLPHIMEHSVLNGSRRFPVKSPFDVLAKGSLNTFLNAMTGDDFTIYPVAGMNEKDYFNLMHVYLDAVFFPLIYDDPRIFMQEGWHYELTDKEATPVFKGVVYNEMKGAFSNPLRELNYQVFKGLFPNAPYRFSAGGHPSAIPDLSYEEFLDFHRRCYHPSNCLIFLYGNADLEKELEFIDSAYLSHFDRADRAQTIPLQPPFEERRKVTSPYSATAGADPARDSYLTLSWVTGSGRDRTLVTALEVLQDVLVEQETAPLRLALQQAGIGREVSSSVEDLNQCVFQILVQNADARDAERFLEVVMQTLRRAVEEGLDKKAVEGAINRLEFSLREDNDPQRGLKYIFRALPAWMYAGDPFAGLEYEKPLAEVKKALTTPFFEEVIRTHLIDNPHALLLTLVPQPGLEAETAERTEERLRAFKTSLDEQQIDELVRKTEELIAYQQQEDSPEALATIPVLQLEDVDRQAPWYELQEEVIAGRPVFRYQDFTNGVVYLRLLFDLRGLTPEQLPYAELLSELLSALDTEKRSYGDLDKELNLYTGGFNAYLDTFLPERRDERLLPQFIVSAKTMSAHIERTLSLVDEIVRLTRFDDRERLKTLLQRRQSHWEEYVKSNGLAVARTRLASAFSRQGWFEEKTGGLDYYRFITAAADSFDRQAERIIDELQRTASMLFRRGNLTVLVTCGADEWKTVYGLLPAFIGEFPEQPVEPVDFAPVPEKRNVGLAAASKVQYVVKGYDFKQLGYSWNGKLRVLDQVLSRDYLQNKIRVIGGAYGGFSTISPSGRFIMASYRDPNLRETLQAFDGAPDFLRSFQVDDQEMTRFIIGTVARLDRPMTAAAKGDLALRRRLEGVTREEVQRERDELLSTTVEDLRALVPLTADVLKQNLYCVYGSEQKLAAEKQLFDDIVTIGR